MPQRLISFDLKADFGCMKKPDVNDGLMLTFNMLHKPALLGILGAIVGLKGYSKNKEFPEYYTVFKDLKIGIEPLLHDLSINMHISKKKEIKGRERYWKLEQINR